MSIVYIVSVISVLYGVSWVLFAIIDPPPSLSFFYMSPGVLSFLPDFLGKLIVGAVFIVLVPMGATLIVQMFMR